MLLPGINGAIKSAGSLSTDFKIFDFGTAKLIDLKLAIFDLITYYLKDEHKQRQTLGGATLQNQGTSGMKSSSDFPDHIKRVLDLYRVVV